MRGVQGRNGRRDLVTLLLITYSYVRTTRPIWVGRDETNDRHDTRKPPSSLETTAPLSPTRWRTLQPTMLRKHPTHHDSHLGGDLPGLGTVVRGCDWIPRVHRQRQSPLADRGMGHPLDLCDLDGGLWRVSDGDHECEFHQRNGGSAMACCELLDVALDCDGLGVFLVFHANGSDCLLVETTGSSRPEPRSRGSESAKSANVATHCGVIVTADIATDLGVPSGGQEDGIRVADDPAWESSRVGGYGLVSSST